MKSGRIQFWDINSGRTVLTLCGHEGAVNTVKTIDRNTIASGGIDTRILIWDIEKAAIVQILKYHQDEVNSIEYLSTGYLVRFF